MCHSFCSCCCKSPHVPRGAHRFIMHRIPLASYAKLNFCMLSVTTSLQRTRFSTRSLALTELCWLPSLSWRSAEAPVCSHAYETELALSTALLAAFGCSGLRSLPERQMARSHLGAYKPTAVGRIISAGHVMGRNRMLSEGFSRLQMQCFASMQVVAQVIHPLTREFF